ncbi:UDP-2,3-diacylglucosamine diphosphatase [Gammaproteobacteria bacterium]|jgi:UDP-2,3-diacylglucosamine hydrolase|nr:UDP-2,3-diacylglucosamine diphosphatase [Gammaproteobacteria bacterium]
MKLGFISDLHLSEKTPSTNEGFFKFLKTAAQEFSHLYILGDLFESWIGDDDDSSFACGVTEHIKAATRSGLEIFFMHGNRDFLCGKKFAEDANITILPDPFFIDYFDQKIALSHGDDFCTDDLKYIEFKKEVRSSLWQEDFLHKSLDERKKIASNMRDASQSNKDKKDLSIMDVTANTIHKFFIQNDISLLIHGHTHRPNTHQISESGINGMRIVLGDWHDTGWCLTLEDQKRTLEEFKL